MNNKELIDKIMKEETVGLNIKFRGAKDKLIFSYRDVVEILEKFIKESGK